MEILQRFSHMLPVLVQERLAIFNCFLRCCFDILGIILSQIDIFFNLIFVKIISRPCVAEAYL